MRACEESVFVVRWESRCKLRTLHSTGPVSPGSGEPVVLTECAAMAYDASHHEGPAEAVARCGRVSEGLARMLNECNPCADAWQVKRGDMPIPIYRGTIAGKTRRRASKSIGRMINTNVPILNRKSTAPPERHCTRVRTRRECR